MKKKLWALLLGSFLVGSISVASAQGTEQAATGEQTLKEQFQSLKKSSTTYKNGAGVPYKVIKEVSYDKIVRVVEDSIVGHRNLLKQTNAQLAESNEEIVRLNDMISSKDKEIEENIYQVSHLTALGIDWNKNTFKVTSFGIILSLVAALVFAFTRVKFSNNTAASKTSDYEELHEEFESYKQRMRERETKLRRELTTEMNKVEELKASLKRGTNA
ncbi:MULTISPECIES: hypothetical protein [Persicobacter]|uniref:tRNA (Guanine-N1)-methyltransferase n=1 Tax=Persicobacter diffluens TaxID=981 RepID=A0AAN4VUQ9_9BACT|nr:hypothetical protein [Persicobacter sp. CCB-QB2]GJM59752.1 hypothetical protein PEDI_03040 [Persicobacter diffluens]